MDSRLARVAEVLVFYLMRRKEGRRGSAGCEAKGGEEERREKGREGDTGRTDIGLIESSGDLDETGKEESGQHVRKKRGG